MKLWQLIAFYGVLVGLLIFFDQWVYGTDPLRGALFLVFLVVVSGLGLAHDIKRAAESSRALVAGLRVNDDGTIGRRP